MSSFLVFVGAPERSWSTPGPLRSRETRLAAGYCSRHLVAEACPYANVCETCDNFTPTPEFAPILTAQLDDIRQLQEDASTRGWTSEVERHRSVITDLERHLDRITENPGHRNFS